MAQCDIFTQGAQKMQATKVFVTAVTNEYWPIFKTLTRTLE